jgi:hypothetical protein
MKNSPSFVLNLSQKIITENQVKRMREKEKHGSEGMKSVTIRMSPELKNLLDTQRTLTGQTVTKILERAIANLSHSNQARSPSSNNQEMHTRQLKEIANDLRQIAHKVDKVVAKRAPNKYDSLDVVVVGKRHPWQNHPQKEKIFQVVRAMHRVGANLSMIASGLNFEGLKKNTMSGQWRETDLKKILEEIKRESDYLPPVYSLPDKS